MKIAAAADPGHGSGGKDGNGRGGARRDPKQGAVIVSVDETAPQALPETGGPGIEIETVGTAEGFCRIVAESLGAPLAAVGVAHDHVFEVIAGHAWWDVADPGSIAIGRYVADHGRLIVEDLSVDPRFRDHPAVAGVPHVRFFAGVSFDLGYPDRRGVLVVAGPEPRRLEPDEIDRLLRYARLAAVLLRAPASAIDAVASGNQARLIELKDRELSRRHRLLMQAETLARIGGWFYDVDGGGADWSDEMFKIFDMPAGVPPPLGEFVASFSSDAGEMIAAATRAAIEDATPFDIEAPLITRAGHLKVIRLMGEAEVVDGRTRRIFGIAQDVTDRKRTEERNWRLANHDFLTRLPNRRLFDEALERAIEFARVDGSHVGLLLIDLDYFKEINVSLGHEVGDVMLHVIAGRLRRLAGSGDEVARIGGDEFAVLLRDASAPANLVTLARKFIRAIEEPVTVRDREVACRASVGGALFPDHARSAGDLLNRANAALDRAKTTGRRIAVVYDDEMRRESETRFRVHEAIRGALGRDEIFPYYQPKVDLRDGRVLGLEALVRWRTAPGGVVVPAEFGAALADGFLGSAIGTRVIEKVTDDIRAWLDADLPFGSVAVNVSAMELMRGAYHEQVSEILSRKGIPFDRFQVEVTETVFVQHEGREIRDSIRRLDAMGVKVALDDFGTGFGSLVHLRRLAVSQIKIDRSFIAGIESDEEDYLIVKALVELGHGLGKTVIAEGIEQACERDVLIELGCDQGQGYLFGLPLPRADTTSMLAAAKAGAAPRRLG